MKKIILVLILILFPVILFASPFGLKKGMTLEEIAEQCETEPEFIEDDIYSITPIKKHPLFTTYYVCVNKKTGLYKIQAITNSISTNQYGTELKEAFNDIKDRIAKTYNKPIITDRLIKTVNSYYQKEENWFYTLQEGSRELSATWGTSEELKDDLDIIKLYCIASSGLYKGYTRIYLTYTFNNTSEIEDEQDSVF